MKIRPSIRLFSAVALLTTSTMAQISWHESVGAALARADKAQVIVVCVFDSV